MIKNFKQFMLLESETQSQDEEQPKKGKGVPTLRIINDMEYNNPDTLWFITIDIKDIWDQYKAKTLKFEDFAKQLNDKLLGQKAELEKIGSCWNDLVEITNQVGDYDEEKANKYFNRIYDWGDEHGVQISIGQPQTQETQPQETQSQTQPVQNNDEPL